MYGPRQKHVDPFAKIIPKWYKCNHVSGRSCSRTVMKSGTACEGCQPVHQSQSFCEECFSMLRAFGMRPDR